MELHLHWDVPLDGWNFEKIRTSFAFFHWLHFVSLLSVCLFVFLYMYVMSIYLLNDIAPAAITISIFFFAMKHLFFFLSPRLGHTFHRFRCRSIFSNEFKLKKKTVPTLSILISNINGLVRINSNGIYCVYLFAQTIFFYFDAAVNQKNMFDYYTFIHWMWLAQRNILLHTNYHTNIVKNCIDLSLRCCSHIIP